MTRQQRRHWERGIRSLHAEAGGVLRLMLVTAAHALALAGAAAADDASALSYLRALDTFRRRIDGPADGAPLCLTCDRPLGADAPLFALVIPARDDASRCLAVGLCPACATRHRNRAEAETTITGALRMLWSDLRPVVPRSSPTGRA